MISFFVVFFLPLTFPFFVLCQQSKIPSMYHFLHSSPTLSRSLLMQPPNRHFGLRLLHFHSTFWAPALFASFSFPIFFYMTSLCTPYQFLPPLSFNPFSRISSLNSHDYSYQVLFRKPGHSRVVSLLVPSSSGALMYAGVTHELSMFPLRLGPTGYASISH